MSAKKHICGVYKGHRIVQEYEQIGNGIYSTFYPCQKKGNRWYKIKDVVSSNIENIKKYINNHETEK